MARHSARARWVRTGAALILTGTVLALATLYAYYVLFSTFAAYDDEGFLDISVRHFVQGRTLYDDVFTQYGPFFYLFNWVVFRFAPFAVDLDSVRLLVLGIWIGCAALVGATTFRLTRNVPLGLVALAFAAVHLHPLAKEPGHPQGLGMLLILLLPATATFLTDRRRTLICATLGALVGCLLMTKVNLGVFCLLALALTLASTIPGRPALVLRIAVGVAMLALPAVLMRLHIHVGWTYRYAMTVTLAALPVVWLHWSSLASVCLAARDGAVAAVTCIAVSLVISAAVVIHGTSLGGLIVGAWLRALQFPTVLYLPAPVGADAVRLALGGLIAFFAIQLMRRRWGDRPLFELTLGGLKVGYGAWALFTVYWAIPHGLNERTGVYACNPAPLLCALPFVWLLMVGGAKPWSPMQRFARALLSSVAVLNSLQAYPVAGSQLTCATALVVLAAVVCLHDGVVGVAEIAPRPLRRRWFALAVQGVSVALLLMMQWDLMRSTRQNYHALEPLNLPGATRLRLPEGSVALYRWLAYNMSAYADTFVSMPAINSLYVWSGKEPPTGLNPNAWALLLDDAQQQNIVDALADRPNAVALRIQWLNDFYAQGRPPASQPLANYINDEFRTVGRFRGYEFRVRKERSDPELLDCARQVPLTQEKPKTWRGRVSLPVQKNRFLYRMILFDVSYTRILADTHPADGVAKLWLIDERHGDPDPVALPPTGLDLSQRWRFALRASPLPSDVSGGEDMLIRLLDKQGKTFRSLPVVRQPGTFPGE